MVLPALDEYQEPAFVVYADGGTLGGSPGSHGVRWSVGRADGPILRQVDTTGRFRRSEEAEFLAFVEAVRQIRDTCGRGEAALVVTDCSTVLHHFGDRHVPRRRRLRDLYALGRDLMKELRFHGVDVRIAQRGRDEVEAVLGH